MTQFVTIEKGLGPEGRIAIVRFDRGDGINALSPEALRQLTDAARSFEDDGETSVVVLTGGARSFSAGFDLKDSEGKGSHRDDRKAIRRNDFNPSFAEASDMEVTAYPDEEGRVLSVSRPAYQLKGRVIRPGLVKVARYVKPGKA